MRIIISPAKNLREEPLRIEALPEKPIFFAEEMKVLESYLFTESFEAANCVWKVSEKLAEASFERYLDARERGDTRAAIELYNGAVYKNLDLQSLKPEAIEFLKKHLLIVSAYYGLLEANSYILPYRLEMDSKVDLMVKGEKLESLYDFWGAKVSKKVESLLQNDDDKFIINLASQNYARLVLQNLADDIKVHEVLFYSLRRDKKGEVVYKNIATIAKIQRGKFLRFIVENGIEDIRGLEKYSQDGFKYDAKKSVPCKLVFVRDDR